MAWIEGGSFLMGSDAGYPEEAPVRSASTGGFWIDRHPVTTAPSTASCRRRVT